MANIFKSDEPKKKRVIDLSIDSSRQLSAFEKKILKLREEADEARAEAERVAQDIIAKAQEEAESIRSDAHNEGIEKGKGESMAQLEELSQSLRGEIEKVIQTQEELINKARESVIDFTFKLARLIIGSEVATDPSLVERHLERLLERMNFEGKVEIRISDEDFDTIDSYLRDSGYNMDTGGYEIKTDPSLSRGGVKVSTPAMGIDGSFEGMLQRVEAVVRNMLNENE